MPEADIHKAFTKDEEPSQDGAEDPYSGYTWTQKCTMSEIKDRGFMLANQLHVALVKAIFSDLEALGGADAPGQAKSGSGMPSESHENAMLIYSIRALKSNEDMLWPEMIRLLLSHADERLDIDIEAIQENDYISDLLKKVGGLSPQEYTWNLTYKEKIDLLLFLVDTVHDLDSFRQFLNKRLDDKSALFKQKNDIHAEIKKIE